MKIEIKRFDPSLPMPEFKTDGATCADLYLREDTTVQPQSIGYFPLNIAAAIPEDTWLLVATRSSTHKLGLIPANGIGIGDWDFRGDNDEWKLALFNFTKREITVPKGARIAQMTLVSKPKIELVEVESLENKDRGGFGTTGFTDDSLIDTKLLEQLKNGNK